MKKYLCKAIALLLILSVFLQITPMNIRAAEAELTLSPILTLDDEANADSYAIDFAGDQTEKVFPINLEVKGGLYLYLEEKTTEYSYLEADLYEDESCTTEVGYGITLFSGDVSKNKDILITKSGTYYLKLKLNRKYGNTDAFSFDLQIALFSGEDRTLEPDNIYCSYQDYDSDPIYWC